MAKIKKLPVKTKKSNVYGKNLDKTFTGYLKWILVTLMAFLMCLAIIDARADTTQSCLTLGNGQLVCTTLTNNSDNPNLTTTTCRNDVCSSD